MRGHDDGTVHAGFAVLGDPDGPGADFPVAAAARLFLFFKSSQ